MSRLFLEAELAALGCTWADRVRAQSAGPQDMDADRIGGTYRNAPAGPRALDIHAHRRYSGTPGWGAALPISHRARPGIIV
jgi:hypothetical protein